MSLKIKSLTRESRDQIIVTYDLLDPGPTTTLELELSVVIQPDGINTKMTLEGPKTKFLEESLDKLAEWLERSARAIRDRQQPRSIYIELYGDGPNL